MIHVAFAPDDNYVMPTAVAMASLLENTPEDVVLYLIYIEGHLSKYNIDVLSKIANKYKTIIKLVSVPRNELEEFPKFRHGLSAYLRIMTPYLLPNLDKLLYLDGDIIVEKSLLELYQINLSDKEWAAVADLKPFVDSGYVESIGFNLKAHPYVNSGVMLLNLAEMRKRNIKERVQNYLSKYKDIIYHEDQDILNCCCDDIIILPPKYNCIIHLWTNKYELCKSVWSSEDIQEAKERPVIIHFLGGHKPWKYLTLHPYKKRWFYYLDKTDYKGWRPKSTIKEKLQKLKSVILDIKHNLC